MKKNEKKARYINDYPDVMNINQASDLLGICDKTLYKLIHDGEIQAQRVGREYRIAKCHIARYLQIA